MKKIFYFTACLFFSSIMQAQTVKTQVVENGGTGDFKAEIVSDSSCERFTIYRPQNLKEVVNKNGKLPIILYANGGCANNNLEIRYFLNEVVSHGYLAAAIGPYDEDDFFAHWTDIMQMMYPQGKTVVLANGQEVKRLSKEEVAAREAEIRKMIEADRKAAEAAKSNKKGKKAQLAPVPRQQTYPMMLLEVMDWLTAQNADPKSEYYHCLDLDQVVAMGQSCGGAQALGVAHDPRIKTCVILNSGIGDMEMQGVTPKQLENIHTPMFYLIGGPEDIAFPNAKKDFERLNQVPVVMINTIDGHEGTYYEKAGGPYAVAVVKWLDWQLKGKVGQSALFLDDSYIKTFFPTWEIERKNF